MEKRTFLMRGVVVAAKPGQSFPELPPAGSVSAVYDLDSFLGHGVRKLKDVHSRLKQRFADAKFLEVHTISRSKGFVLLGAMEVIDAGGNRDPERGFDTSKQTIQLERDGLWGTLKRVLVGQPHDLFRRIMFIVTNESFAYGESDSAMHERSPFVGMSYDLPQDIGNLKANGYRCHCTIYLIEKRSSVMYDLMKQSPISAEAHLRLAGLWPSGLSQEQPKPGKAKPSRKR